MCAAWMSSSGTGITINCLCLSISQCRQTWIICNFFNTEYHQYYRNKAIFDDNYLQDGHMYTHFFFFMVFGVSKSKTWTWTLELYCDLLLRNSSWIAEQNLTQLVRITCTRHLIRCTFIFLFSITEWVFGFPFCNMDLADWGIDDVFLRWLAHFDSSTTVD